MNTPATGKALSTRVTLAVAAVAFAAFSTITLAKEIKITLGGDQEVPPVTTSASGTGTIVINDDKSVSGSITTTGVVSVAAHIHEGAAGKNGPVSVPLVKAGDHGWTVAAGAKLTDAQFESFKAGNLYVNVHSAAHKGGEIRGQLKP